MNAPIDGFDTDRETFIGLYNEFRDPQNVLAGVAGNSIAHGWSPLASHCIEVELQPGESKDYIFLLGYVENAQDEKFVPQAEPGLLHSGSSPIINKAKARAMIASLDTAAKVDAAFAQLKAYWDSLLDIFKHTGTVCLTYSQ